VDCACALRHFPHIVHSLLDFSGQTFRLSLSRLEETTARDSPTGMSDMKMIEDYPGPTKGQPEKEGVGFPADEEIVKPPVTPEEEDDR
jgi:hypothetical protein